MTSHRREAKPVDKFTFQELGLKTILGLPQWRGLEMKEWLPKTGHWKKKITLTSLNLLGWEKRRKVFLFYEFLWLLLGSLYREGTVQCWRGVGLGQHVSHFSQRRQGLCWMQLFDVNFEIVCLRV